MTAFKDGFLAFAVTVRMLLVGDFMSVLHCTNLIKSYFTYRESSTEGSLMLMIKECPKLLALCYSCGQPSQLPNRISLTSTHRGQAGLPWVQFH